MCSGTKVRGSFDKGIAIEKWGFFSVMVRAIGKLQPRRSDYIALGCVLLSTALAAVYLTWFICTCEQYQLTGVDSINGLTLSALPLLMALLLVFAAVFLAACTSRGRHVFHMLFDYRIVIGAVVVAALTVFKISGSSIALWAETLASDDVNGVLFGIPRGIRSDEFLVNTPLAFSQEWTGYSAVSILLRGASTDVTMIYAQPCWAFATLFRPFLWGYLLFGSEMGLAFFWSARLVVLFLVSIEMGMLLSCGRKGVSIAFAMLVAFSTVVQWWFAVNGIAELLIFGQGLVLTLHHYLRTESMRVRIMQAILLSWMATGYLMVIYPAWQIPFFYIFLAAGIGDIVEWCRGIEKKERSSELLRALPLLLLAIVLVAIFAAVSIVPVLDIVQTTMDTEYPGHRYDYGGGSVNQYTSVEILFMWIPSIFNSLQASLSQINASELSGFYSLFPLGVCFGIIGQFLTRKKGRPCSPVIIALLFAELILLIYVVIGLPVPIAEMSLLASSRGIRAAQIIGYAELSIVIATISTVTGNTLEAEGTGNVKCRDRSSMRIIVSGVITISLYLLLCVYMGHVVFDLRWAFTGLIVAAVGLTALVVLLACSNRKYDYVLPVCVAIIAISGLCANPVQIGAGPLVDSEAYDAIRQMAGQDDALWAGDNSSLGQLCVAAGAPCVNSINTYPELERWSQIDPKCQYRDVYNRYAHIYINLVDSDIDEASFSSDFPDRFTVSLDIDMLYNLGVRYFISYRGDLEQLSSEEHRFELERQTGSIYIWRISSAGRAEE